MSGENAADRPTRKVGPALYKPVRPWHKSGMDTAAIAQSALAMPTRVVTHGA